MYEIVWNILKFNNIMIILILVLNSINEFLQKKNQ